MARSIGMNQLAALEAASNGRATVAVVGDELADRVGGERADAVARQVIASLRTRGLLTPDGKLTPAGTDAMNAKHAWLATQGS